MIDGLLLAFALGTLLALLVWHIWLLQEERDARADDQRAWANERAKYIQQLTGVRLSPPEPGPRRAYGTDEDEWAVDMARRAEGRESGEPQ